MSAFKNFGIYGVGADVQFGKGGNRIVSSAGALLLVNASGSPVRLTIADGTGASDAVSFGQLTAAVSSAVSTLNANIASVQGSVTSLSSATSANASALWSLITSQGQSISSINSNLAANASAIAGLQSNAITLSTQINGEIARAGAAETSINSAITAETTRATNAEAVLTANVASLSSRITGLGNVFNYKGKLDGTNLNLDSVDASSHIGDYYKVGSSGTYTYTDSTNGASSIVVNVNDGLVKSATGWDKIDNTDSTVTGTANLIAVSGSTDTGYTVTIDPTFQGRVSVLESNAVAQQTTITNEISRATAAEGTLTTNLAAVRVGAGLAANGSYVANGSGNFIGSATSLFDSNNRLDAALYALSQTVASLSMSTIKSASNLYQVQATNTDVEIFGNVGGVSTLFANFVTGSTQNATLTLSTATAGEVRIEAHSGSVSNVDVHLVPLGSGVVNVSGARLTQVATATANTDATNLGQVNTAISTAVTAALAGAVRTVTATLSSSSATVNAGAAIKGTVTRVLVKVTAAYAGGSQITVGDTTTASSLAAATDIDEGTVGLYVIEGIATYGSATQLTATVSSGGATGAATVIIEYVQG